MENQKIGFIVCSNFWHETNEVIKMLKLDNVEIMTFPSNCASFSNNDKLGVWNVVQNMKLKVKHLKILAPLGCTGINCKENNHNLLCADSTNCMEQLIPKPYIEQLIQQGTYIIHTSWLKKWSHFIQKRWLFNSETAKMFFNESVKDVLILKTYHYPEFDNDLQNLQNFIGVKCSIMNIGLSQYSLYIENIVLKIRKEDDKKDFADYKKQKNRELSSFAMSLDVIPQLAGKHTEIEVINGVFDLFMMLFAPENMFYIPFINNNYGVPITFRQNSFPNRNVFDFLDFSENIFVNEQQNGFILKLKYMKEIYAFLVIEKVEFPQYLKSYISILDLLTAFLGLFISNSRNFQALEKAKIKAEKDALTIALQNSEYEALNEELLQTLEEIKTLNEDLTHKNNELYDLNSIKDKFFSIIAHDLKNPFSTILGFAELLKDKLHIYSHERAIKIIEMVHITAINAYDLLQNLLVWARSQTGRMNFEPEKIKLFDLINSTIEETRGSALAKNIDITVQGFENAVIMGDLNMLKTVLRNLITNAIKFTYRDGNISIVVSDENDKYIVSVNDSGIGIPEGVLKKLFRLDSHYTSKGTDNEKGTGLGLLLAKEFVDRHQGKIWAESKQQKGSSFKFSLPKEF